ncbi:hypothetical protein L6164_006488 [Bauhinia variegata]|uniref:Uncharacterized protein n=1 Tax=Bauhinia variegata TaxID=167791 RepID=A0ACB9PV49_BAUVA|nr:hypothetical protein L6164_006488 [Bauhinia variegata]
MSNMQAMENEQAKIRLMRSNVESKDPSAKEADDAMIRRFLRACNLDVEKASAKFLKYLKWRRSFVPNGSISESEIANELAQQKLFMQGFNKKGQPISVSFGAKHFQNKNDPDEFKRLMVYSYDKLCARTPPGQEKFVLISDLKGWKYANSDLRGHISSLTILQDYYPGRLGKCYVVNAPYLFMTVWKSISPFLDEKTKKKIIFVDNKKLKSTLLEKIDESQLPEIYGGQLPLVPIQDS